MARWEANLREAGLEPARSFLRGFLRPLRLPFRHSRKETSATATYAIGTTGRNRLGTKLDASANGALFGTVQPA